MKLSKIFLSLCAATFVSAAVGADNAKSASAAAKVVEERFNVKVKSARYNPDLNLVEVFAENNELVYVTPNAKYLLLGTIVEINSQKNLTQAALDELTRFAPNEIPASFIFSRAARGGNGQQLWVFTDPKCAYCRRLEPELDKLSNVTINYIPLSYQRSENEVAAVLCAQDKLKAWKDILSGKPVGEAKAGQDCLETAAKIREFAWFRAINSTPTMIRADGARLTGYTSAEKIMAFLNGQ